MSEVQVFNHAEYGQHVARKDVRGNAVFVLSPIAKTLGYRDAEKAKRILDRDEYWLEVVDLPAPERGTSQVRRRVLVVSESGLYHLVFKSGKAEAKQFRRWVTEEVLPTLRKAHEYGIDAIAELKTRIAELESTVELHEISAEAEPLRARKEFLSGVEAGRNNPDLDYHAIYEGRFVKWEQGFDD